MFNPLMSATTYGRKPKPTGAPDEFKLSVYTGGLGASETANKCAAGVLDKFKSENGYAAYEIVAREGRWFPSGYNYTVRFRK